MIEQIRSPINALLTFKVHGREEAAERAEGGSETVGQVFQVRPSRDLRHVHPDVLHRGRGQERHHFQYVEGWMRVSFLFLTFCGAGRGAPPINFSQIEAWAAIVMMTKRVAEEGRGGPWTRGPWMWRMIRSF